MPLSGKTKRHSFSRIGDSVPIPDLLDIQKLSFDEFLQEEGDIRKRADVGLQRAFTEIFPIKSHDGSSALEFVSYALGKARFTPDECQAKGLTYAVPLRVKLRLRKGDVVREESVFIGNIPYMTDSGSFIINGAERVIVCQLQRTPGICFEEVKRSGRNVLYMFRIIPIHGSWMEAEFNRKGQIFFYMDKKRARHRFLATTILRALGYGSDRKIIKLFCELEELKVGSADLPGRYLSLPVFDGDNNLIAPAYHHLTPELIETIKSAGVGKVEVFVPGACVEPLVSMLLEEDKEPKERQLKSQQSAMKFIFHKLRQGDPPTEAKAQALIERRFFDPRFFDLGKVGRYKINQKLDLSGRDDKGNTTLQRRDVVEALRYLMKLSAREEGCRIDDIDHLGNRRVKMVGELLQEQFRLGLVRLERFIREKMNIYETSAEVLTPNKLVNPKALTSALRDFFGRSQLSQFMDQTNPLAELTHKRRLTALGPGGLSRKRAGFEVRDVHTSHYGRICPIETPEGPNIGLIASLSNYGRVNELGFIETPYRLVVDKKVTNRIKYLTADEEEKYVIAPPSIPVDKNGKILPGLIQIRHQGDFKVVYSDQVQLVDTSPKQLVSLAAGLIPFLEHNDANRALMGSNMQRQAAAPIQTERPLVVTGLEEKAARDSRVMMVAEEDGEVKKVDSLSITVGRKTYGLKKFARSNAGTCINQTPIVRVGQKVKKGQVIADGPATCGGELALGRNVLVAFMPWRGYNFEDAIAVSERLVREDHFTSIHIEKFEIGSRDTKLGREEITRDIPGIGDEALKNLDEEGVVRIGAEVRPNDILVGKITPKVETELLPEEKLLRAIFGEKAADVKDTSLRAPSGVEGIVMDVKVFSRKERAEEGSSEDSALRQINRRYKQSLLAVKARRKEKVASLLQGKKIEGTVVADDTGAVIIPGGKKITRAMLQKLEATDYEEIHIEGEDEAVEALKRIVADVQVQLQDLDLKRAQELDQVKVDDDLEPGMVKKVQVFVATKRKMSVGDKMAGRHGNKGVIGKILPEEDMPFLADGTPVDIVLNPLGVPSRMNVGQVMETQLGWVAKLLGLSFQTPVFDGAGEAEIDEWAKKAGVPPSGKVDVFDGRTGERFDSKVLAGYIYMMKLNHLAADKIHARATGPYSLVTQQPLGGKAQFGGQRFGEMEVWALQAYGAAYALQEMLTVKSDDIAGRTRIYESIVKGSNTLEAGTPESFNVLINELRSLALDIRAEKPSPLK